MTAAYNSDLNEALARARADLGLIINQPIIDGQLHRCPVDGGRPGNMDGAYRICVDYPPNLWCQNFRLGIKKVFSFGSSEAWSPAEHQAWAAKAKRDQRAREADQRKAWAVAAQRAERIYAAAQPCVGHPYLTAKGVQPCQRLRVSGKDLIVPLYNGTGALATLQFIDESGQKKRFLRSGRKGGSCLPINTGDQNRRQALLVCEGLATALALFESAGLEVLTAFDAANMKPVAVEARQIWPERVIIMTADNDCGGAGNVGVVKAKEAALAVGGLLTVPIMADGRACDFNDLYITQGPETVRAFLEAAFTVEGVHNA